MKDEFNDIKIIDNKCLDKLTGNNNIIIKNVINLDDNKNLVEIVKNEEQFIISMIDNLSADHNINIAIASFVSAYAIYISQFKNNKNIKLYYTDTDSIIVSKDSIIPSDLINNKSLIKVIIYYIKRYLFTLYFLLDSNQN